MFDPIQFGQRIKKARKDAGLTMNQVSAMIYFSQSLISRYELGQVTPPIDRVIDLCKLYGCSMDVVCGLDDTKQNGLDGSKEHEQEPAEKAGAG